MSKLSLDRVTSSFGFQAAFNSVLESIEQEFSEKVLYRDNPMGTNNVMKNDIDMGEHDILNVGKVDASDFTINGVEITQSLEEALAEVAAYPAEAKGYRDEAEGFRNDAEGFASSAALSEHNAALSASQAFAWKEDAEIAASTAANDAAANVSGLLAGYVTDAEGFADDAEQSAIDAAAAVSGLGTRVDVLESDLPALELIVAEKLDKDDNISIGASVAASGTAVEFVGIPVGVKRITVMFNGVSFVGTANMLIRLGSAGIVSTGYLSHSAAIQGTSVSSVVSSTGFIFNSSGAAISVYGSLILTKTTGNIWLSNGFLFGDATVDYSFSSSGSKSLGGNLDAIQVLSSTGTDNFDAGTINISWEF